MHLAGLPLVGPGVELHEEDEEGDHVSGANDALDHGEVAVVVVGQQEAVEQHRAELDNLEKVAQEMPKTK